MPKSHYDQHYNQNYYALNTKKRSRIFQYFIELAQRREPILKIIKKYKAKGATLLEVGCGSGAFLKHVQNDYICTGIDLSQAAINEAKMVAPKAKVLKKSAYDLSDF